MSNTDSFIDEVNEELRQDRLFTAFRRYGWIGILLVLLVVGGAAYNEWQKAQKQAAAQAFGDQILAAEELNDELRDDAFSAISTTGSNRALVAMLKDDGGELGAADLRAVLADQNVEQLYRDLATFKLAMRTQSVSAEEARELLSGLDEAGSPFRVFASEQLALLDVAAGENDAAVTRLQALINDNESSAALRRRVTQLIIALGKTPEAA